MDVKKKSTKVAAKNKKEGAKDANPINVCIVPFLDYHTQIEGKYYFPFFKFQNWNEQSGCTLKFQRDDFMNYKADKANAYPFESPVMLIRVPGQFVAEEVFPLGQNFFDVKGPADAKLARFSWIAVSLQITPTDDDLVTIGSDLFYLKSLQLPQNPFIHLSKKTRFTPADINAITSWDFDPSVTKNVTDVQNPFSFLFTPQGFKDWVKAVQVSRIELPYDLFISPLDLNGALTWAINSYKSEPTLWEQAYYRLMPGTDGQITLGAFGPKTNGAGGSDDKSRPMPGSKQTQPNYEFSVGTIKQLASIFIVSAPDNHSKLAPSAEDYLNAKHLLLTGLGGTWNMGWELKNVLSGPGSLIAIQTNGADGEMTYQTPTILVVVAPFGFFMKLKHINKKITQTQNHDNLTGNIGFWVLEFINKPKFIERDFFFPNPNTVSPGPDKIAEIPFAKVSPPLDRLQYIIDNPVFYDRNNNPIGPGGDPINNGVYFDPKFGGNDLQMIFNVTDLDSKSFQIDSKARCIMKGHYNDTDIWKYAAPGAQTLQTITVDARNQEIALIPNPDASATNTNYIKQTGLIQFNFERSSGTPIPLDININPMRPVLSKMNVGIPELAKLLGNNTLQVDVSYYGTPNVSNYFNINPFLKVNTPQLISFAQNADQVGSLCVPNLNFKFYGFQTGLIGGPTTATPLPQLNLQNFFSNAKLLGLDLSSILSNIGVWSGSSGFSNVLPGLKIVGDCVQYNFSLSGSKYFQKYNAGLFAFYPETNPDTTFSLTAQKCIDHSNDSITCGLQNFQLAMLPNQIPPGIVVFWFDYVNFVYKGGAVSHNIHLKKVDFNGFLQVLAAIMSAIEGGDDDIYDFSSLDLQISSDALSFTKLFTFPTISAGYLSIYGLSLLTGIRIQLSGPNAGQVTLRIGVSSPQSPFIVAVWIVGGGGSFEADIPVRANAPITFLYSVQLGGFFSLGIPDVFEAVVYVMISYSVNYDNSGNLAHSFGLKIYGHADILGIGITIYLDLEDDGGYFKGPLVINISLAFFSINYSVTVSIKSPFGLAEPEALNNNKKKALKTGSNPTITGSIDDDHVHSIMDWDRFINAFTN